jgi:hypothetical protein
MNVMFICKINIQSGIIYGIITMYQIWLTGISILTNHWPICVAHTTQNSHYGNFAFCVVWATHISFLDVLSAVPPFLSYAQKPKPVYMSTNFNDAAVYLFHNLFCFKFTNSFLSLRGEIKTIKIITYWLPKTAHFLKFHSHLIQFIFQFIAFCHVLVSVNLQYIK